MMMPPEQRSVGMVFQEGALFPHMSVVDNVAFGLRSNDAKERALEWLTRVGLSDYAIDIPIAYRAGSASELPWLERWRPSLPSCFSMSPTRTSTSSAKNASERCAANHSRDGCSGCLCDA